jgi:hypothetical protein
MSPSLDSRETRPFAFEVKFLVDPAQAERIRTWARGRLNPDPHGAGPWSDEYRTTTLYCDTPDLDVFRQAGSFGRAKYRIRRYGWSGEAHLERKLRSNRLLVKRRTTIDLAGLDRLAGAASGADPRADWFRRRLIARGLRPTAQIAYCRMARIAEGAYGPIRLTLDDDIRAAAINGFAFRDDRGARVLDGGLVLELKYRFAMPAIFKHLVEEFALTARVVSKYRLGAAVALALPAEPRLAAAGRVAGFSLPIAALAAR